MDNTESPMIGVEMMNPDLYKNASLPDISPASVAISISFLTRFAEVNDLTLCLTPQKNTALHIAVEFGLQNIVKKVIELCPSLISQHNSKGDTPLHMAARAGHLYLTNLLTATLNSNWMEGNLALEEGNHVRQAGSVALQKRNLEGNNPIHEALKKSHEKVALHLLAFEERHELSREVNVARESLLYLAAEAGLDEVVKKIIERGDYSTQGPDGQNPLHIAVIKGQLGVVEILLREASNLIPQVDGFGNTMLHYASAPGYRRVFEHDNCDPTHEDDQKKILGRLLEASPSLAYVPNKNGDYPLFIAITEDFTDAVHIILYHCPDSAELVNQNGQNALHLAVMMGKNKYIIERLRSTKLINERDNDGNTPMHLATRTNRYDIVNGLISEGRMRKNWIRWALPDLTMSNKAGLTAMDICGYTETEHPIRDTLREFGAVPGRHHWQVWVPPPPRPAPRITTEKISPEFKKLGLQTLPIVTSLVATVTFAAAFTVPGGYKNDGPREGLPVFLRKPALQAFVLSDILAFCSSMAATVLLVYANAVSEDAFKVYYALKTCYFIAGVAILATITAFVTAVYVLTSKESLWLAVTSLILGIVVPLFLLCFRWGLKKIKWILYSEEEVCYEFIS